MKNCVSDSSISLRVESIDALRGITIFMMILCASIGYFSSLPSWMFHCQVPPPDYVFRPEVRGITWVDMVFPIFIFSMGAAIPFWLGSKVDRGESMWKISLLIIKRFAVLFCFSLAIGHSSAIGATQCPPLLCGAVQFALWLTLFAALVRTPLRWVNPAGWLAAAAIFLWMHSAFGLKFDFAQNDCIIMLLSYVALMGGFIWLASRNDFRIRMAVLLAVIVAKLLGCDFVQYLVIAIPASMVGDLLRGTDARGAVRRESPRESPDNYAATAFVALFAAAVQLWGLFTRNVAADLIISSVLFLVFVFLVRKRLGLVVEIALMGFTLMLVGIVFDHIDGGIAKDYCNMSYLLTTGGMSALLLYFLLWVESVTPLSRMLVLSGRNPMVAYTIGWSVVCPLLVVTGFQGWFDALCAGPHPVLGVVRGLIITLLTVGLTCLFTRLKIYWKS